MYITYRTLVMVSVSRICTILGAMVVWWHISICYMLLHNNCHHHYTHAAMLWGPRTSTQVHTHKFANCYFRRTKVGLASRAKIDYTLRLDNLA